jgi:hypothetical protein
MILSRSRDARGRLMETPAPASARAARRLAAAFGNREICQRQRLLI